VEANMISLQCPTRTSQCYTTPFCFVKYANVVTWLGDRLQGWSRGKR